MKIFCIGSCFSDHMFRNKIMGNYSYGNIELVYHHHHDSFISLMSDPVDVDPEGAKSVYQRDFNCFAASILKKDIIKKISEMQPDYLLLDDFGERACPVLKINDTTYLTDNYYIHNSTIMEQIKIQETLPIISEKRFDLFKKYFALFLDALEAVCPDIKIIYVLMPPTLEYVNADYTKSSLFPNRQNIDVLTSLDKKYSEYFLNNIKNVQTLEMKSEYGTADSIFAYNYISSFNHNHFDINHYKKEQHKLTNIILNDLLGENKKKRYFNQAVIISAYEDFSLLLLLAKIYKDFFYVYIYVNRTLLKNKFTDEQILRLRQIPNVHVIAKDEAVKGSFCETRCLLNIMETAFSNSDINYIHFSTDTQMPIRSVKEIYSFYESRNSSFLNLNFSSDQKDIKTAESTYKYYNYFYDKDLKNPDNKKMYDSCMKKQAELGIRRTGIGEFQTVYKGDYGGSLTREAYNCFIKYIQEHPEYINDIKFTRLGSEFMLHTVLFNSNELSGRVIGGLRGGKASFDWDSEKNDYAAADIEKYKKIRNNREYLYIRKVSSGNRDLVNMILKDIKSPYTL